MPFLLPNQQRQSTECYYTNNTAAQHSLLGLAIMNQSENSNNYCAPGTGGGVL